MMLERIEQQHQEILHFQESMFEISRIHIESGDPGQINVLFRGKGLPCN